jgi:photosystem II stability/assembly factor-like uncharacterized protein
MRPFIIIIGIFFLHTGVRAQQIQLLEKKGGISIRGMSVVNDQVVWVSGSGGAVAKSTDGGKTWRWFQVKGFEKNDFRDIEAFDEKTAVIMAVGEPAFILKTFNGGESWKVVYSDSSKGMFLDAMEFWDNGNGIAVGDPIDGNIYIARTDDFGNSWASSLSNKMTPADKGEAMFASSGTNIRKLSNLEAVVVTGGTRSRLLIHEKWMDLPIIQGAESTGANSVAIWNVPPRKLNIVIVGGDFKNDTSSSKNCTWSTDMGKRWNSPVVPPHGYRSCVEFITADRLLTCGTSGIDVSEDGGKNWRLISPESFHVCRKARSGKSVYLAGANGRIAKLDWQ